MECFRGWREGSGSAAVGAAAAAAGAEHSVLNGGGNNLAIVGSLVESLVL